MKQCSLLLRSAFFLAIAIQITSCQKIFDHWPGHDHGHGDGDSAVKYRIKSIFFVSNITSITDSGRAIFYYGSDNLLDSVIPPRVGSNPSFTFEYGQNGNLKKYIVRQDNPGKPVQQFSDIYGVDNTGRIVSDTFRFVTSAGYSYADTSHLVYDNKGRIVNDYFRTSDYEPGPQSDSVTFTYDANGNRGLVTAPTTYSVHIGGGNTDNTVYDDKVAYRSTNPVFQLIDRDYSKNNSNFATGYNSAGLPLGFARGSTEEFLMLGEPREIEWEEVR